MSTPPLHPHSDAPQVLHPLDFPLHGSRLIEASAGTGKTWTIAALVLRLVLGHGGAQGHPQPLMPAHILVMTFTRAATRELSSRIRARLVQAAQCFRGQAPVPEGDPFLAALLQQYPPGPQREHAAWRLALAAEAMDEAAVFTIDAWCQRMLREHAVDSGQLAEEELSTDERSLQAQAVQDYWRQQCYGLTPAQFDAVARVWPHVDALHADLRKLLDADLPALAQPATLAQCLQAQAQQQQTLRAGWPPRVQALRDWLEVQLQQHKAHWDGRKIQAGRCTTWLDALQQWLDGDLWLPLDWPEAAWRRLTPQGLREARVASAPPLDVPEASAALEHLQQALQATAPLAAQLRLHAATQVQQRVALLKRQGRVLGFHDLLLRLVQALQAPQGARLRERITAQYPVALIDEFQDTSPLQYRLFELLYAPQVPQPDTALLLIGDPKQSIYGFRGADIHSYLRARRATQGRHYLLDTNHRSTQALVGAVNHLFGQAEARGGEGAFLFRSAQGGENPLPFVPVQARGRPEQFQTADGPVPALDIHHDLELAGVPEQRERFAARCAAQIVQWLGDAQTGFVQTGVAQADTPWRRLRPADIAVLVRSRTEAAAVRRQLQQRGVASVYLSDRDSVFDSDEAHDLMWWLQAVADPQDASLLRTGMATRLIGLGLDELAALADDDLAFEQRSSQLRALHAVWRSQGVLTMLRQTLHQFDLPARWLRESGGERRLTNVLHLAELQQEASSHLEGEHALLRWLHTQVHEDRMAGDEQILRLESDADLVQVVTVHKSKGLEYPVVCLPFAWSVPDVRAKAGEYPALPDAQGQRHQHLHWTDELKAQTAHERLREDLRLLYVALTRARHSVWLGFATVRVGNGKQCRTHDSALGCLLAGPQAALEPHDWQMQLQALAEARPALLRVVPAIPLPVPRQALAPAAPAPILALSTPYAAQFDRRWGIGSFSQLVRASAPLSVPLAAMALLRPADDELQPLAPLDVPSAPAAPPNPWAGTPRGRTLDLFDDTPLAAQDLQAAQTAPWHQFVRGSAAGNFLHQQLEWLAAEGFALEPEGPLAERLRRRCERAGHGECAADVLQWLRAVVHTPMPPLGAPLRGLQRLLPEMEFWLPVHRLRAAEVDALCRTHLLPGRERPALPERELRGMLMGFADLVFEHGGRYWVLDYKSNHLGDSGAAYTAEALDAALAAHRYDVQAALYLLALHRLLRARLGAAYAPQQHLGGALFWFLRGIDGPQAGLRHLAPPPALLDALDAMLDPAEAAA